MATVASCTKTSSDNLLDAQREDFVWFLANRPVLHKKYGNVFLAIKDKNVIGVYSSYVDAVQRTQEEQELGSFIVQECTGSSECYTARVASIIELND